MIEFDAIEIDQLIVHRVGNQQQGLPNFLSDETLPVDEELHGLLSTFFFKPFLQATELFQFSHTVDVAYNPMRGITEKMLANDDTFVSHSAQIVEHLFAQSAHPHIKTGDVFIIKFRDLMLNNRLRNGIGIFKSENKHSFLKLVENAQNLALNVQEGISINKLDKGCLILETDEEIKWQILSVDNNNYDAQYWKDDFMGIEYIADNHFNTRQYIEMCKGFAEDVVKPNANKKAEVDFLNQSVKFFNENEQIEKQQFVDVVFENDVQKEAFTNYQQQFEREHEIQFEDAFDVSKPILQKEKRKIKNYIKLDTNIQIKLDFNNPESTQHFIEQGYDDEREMHFYKVYFNREL